MPRRLHLRSDAAAALRALARKSGRWPPKLLHAALDRYLGLTVDPNTRDRAIATGLVRTPSRFRDAEPTLRLDTPGDTSLRLLDR